MYSGSSFSMSERPISSAFGFSEATFSTRATAAMRPAALKVVLEQRGSIWRRSSWMRCVLSASVQWGQIFSESGVWRTVAWSRRPGRSGATSAGAGCRGARRGPTRRSTAAGPQAWRIAARSPEDGSVEPGRSGATSAGSASWTNSTFDGGWSSGAEGSEDQFDGGPLAASAKAATVSW